MYTLEGKVRWASVLNPNTKFEPVYTVDLEINDDRVESWLNEKGFKVRTWDDGQRYFKIKRKVTTRAGKPAEPPKVIGEDGLPFEDLIGNGSVCEVGFDGFEWSSAFGAGTAAYLQEVIVKEHVPFASRVSVLDSLD